MTGKKATLSQERVKIILHYFFEQVILTYEVNMKQDNDLLNLAKANRRNATDAERKLWSLLRAKKMGVVFRRQQQIGQYIVDFVCFEKKLIIECDGSQHLEQKEEDNIRTKFLEQQGYKVIRFWNNEILYATDGAVVIISKSNSLPIRS